MLCQILGKYKRKLFLDALAKATVLTVLPSFLSSIRHRELPFEWLVRVMQSDSLNEIAYYCCPWLPLRCGR